MRLQLLLPWFLPPVHTQPERVHLQEGKGLWPRVLLPPCPHPARTRARATALSPRAGPLLRLHCSYLVKVKFCVFPTFLTPFWQLLLLCCLWHPPWLPHLPLILSVARGSVFLSPCLSWVSITLRTSRHSGPDPPGSPPHLTVTPSCLLPSVSPQSGDQPVDASWT